MNTENFKILQEWHQLLKDGLISEVDFAKKKAELLGLPSEIKKEEQALIFSNAVINTIAGDKKDMTEIAVADIAIESPVTPVDITADSTEKRTDRRFRAIPLAKKMDKLYMIVVITLLLLIAGIVLSYFFYFKEKWLEEKGTYQLVFSDDFSSAAITESQFIFTNLLWGVDQHTVAHAVTNEYLELRQDRTDANGVIMINYNFSSANYIKIVYQQKMHEGVSNYRPGIDFYGYDIPVDLQSNPLSIIQVMFQTSTYSPDCPCGDKLRPQIRLSMANQEGVRCAPDFKRSNSFLTSRSASFYDKWLNTIITFDKTTGYIAVDIEGDNLIDMEGYVPLSVASQQNKIGIANVGWFTGHTLQIKNLKVYTK